MSQKVKMIEEKEYKDKNTEFGMRKKVAIVLFWILLLLLVFVAIKGLIDKNTPLFLIFGVTSFITVVFYQKLIKEIRTLS